MKVLVFGASGGTGRELVRQALARGHSVTAFVRNPADFDIAGSGLIVIPGDVADRAQVTPTVRGHDAVICALGSGRSLKRHPELIEGVRNIVQAMQQEGVRRLVYLSVLGAGDSRHQLGWLDRYFIVPLVLRNVVADHSTKEEIITQSGLDWAIVRPPRLTNGSHTGRYRSGIDIGEGWMTSSISRADLAEFMLGRLATNADVHRTLAVMY